MARGGAGRNPQQKELERGERLRKAARAARIRRVLIAAGIAVVLVGGFAYAATRSGPEELAAVQTFPEQGAEHIEAGAPTPDYNSNPATSGPMANQPAACGVFRSELPDEVVVHNLEHGAIAIRYDPGLAAADRDTLEAFARDAGTHIIVAPRQGLDTPVVVTAWANLLPLEEVALSAVEAFYGRFAQFGPERGVPCPFQVDEGQTEDLSTN